MSHTHREASSCLSHKTIHTLFGISVIFLTSAIPHDLNTSLLLFLVNTVCNQTVFQKILSGIQVSLKALYSKSILSSKPPQ